MKKYGKPAVLWLLALTMLLSAVPVFSADDAGETLTAPAPSTAAMPFADVLPGAWYYADVARACASGLINGRAPDRYEPEGNLLLSEALKLAVCLRRLADGLYETVALENGAEKWYSTYVDFAFEIGLIAKTYEWERAATRAEIMELFLPCAADFPALNDLPEGSLPDVAASHPQHDAVYHMARAGIIQGTDAVTHVVSPDSCVTRAEIAAILSRMTDPAARVRFTVSDVPDTPDDPTDPDPTDPASASVLARYWAANYEKRFGAGSADEVLLTPGEIAAANARKTAACPTMVDLVSYPSSVNGGEVRARIEAYAFPEGCDRDLEGRVIPWNERQAILDNRALSSIPETVTVRWAVVTTRCDMKSLPTELVGIYAAGDVYYSMIQETEVILGEPVAVLHESADGRELFVQTGNYIGWIPSSAAVYCTREVWLKYVLAEDFVTVTSVNTEEVGDEPDWVNGDFVGLLDMGARLPYLGEDDERWYVVMPASDYSPDRCLAEHRAWIPKSDAVRGALPYTVKDFYEQAFKYLGVTYGWGGANGGVDCSGFVCAVMRSFGVKLPRNTSEQREYAGVGQDISSLGAAERSALLGSLRYPTAIYRPGHVMIWLGEENGTPTIVHAYIGGMPVAIQPLDLSGTLLKAVELR